QLRARPAIAEPARIYSLPAARTAVKDDAVAERGRSDSAKPSGTKPAAAKPTGTKPNQAGAAPEPAVQRSRNAG
ncbi:MAG TPA: hypothetical protein VFD94_00925, partial [Jatrophihabitans sp.]|nr:hypothetical protein [Jatrophihabitans sp.]